MENVRVLMSDILETTHTEIEQLSSLKEIVEDLICDIGFKLRLKDEIDFELSCLNQVRDETINDYDGLWITENINEMYE